MLSQKVKQKYIALTGCVRLLAAMRLIATCVVIYTITNVVCSNPEISRIPYTRVHCGGTSVYLGDYVTTVSSLETFPYVSRHECNHNQKL